MKSPNSHAAARGFARPGTALLGPESPSEPRFGPQYLTEYAPLLSHSSHMRAVREIIEDVADSDATVLIRGESGVGKDVVARAIHEASPRRKGPFVKVNCAALPAELIESELFGHEKGAFTGAHRRSLGKFEFANKGTIFLDEIGELPRAVQAKLLHVLQDLQFSRIGGRQVIRVDVRILSSTNRDLEAALGTGEFREDLYYRLNVVEILIPPLRDRKEEIPVLASWFLAKFKQQYGRGGELSPETIALFTNYPWPGNVRQLENTVRRLVVLGKPGQPHDELLTRLRAPPATLPEVPRPSCGTAAGAEGTLGLKEIARRVVLEAERKALTEVLDRVRWNRTEAARILKVSYKTLLHKITACGLGPGQTRPNP